MSESMTPSKLLQSKGRFRLSARMFLESAEALLADNDDLKVDLAALRLRKAFECLALERASVYIEELTDRDLDIWQPRKLMIRLLEIDPTADHDLELSIQDDATGEWHSLGKQDSLHLKDIERSYTALSRLLHTRSLKDILSGNCDDNKSARIICASAAKRLHRVLNSNLWNVALPIGGFITFACSSCGNKVKRRLTALNEGPKEAVESIKADCPKCPATYEVRLSADGHAEWAENVYPVSCTNRDCGETYHIFPQQRREGERVQCPKCETVSTVKQLWVLSSRTSERV